MDIHPLSDMIEYRAKATNMGILILGCRAYIAETLILSENPQTKKKECPFPVSLRELTEEGQIEHFPDFDNRRPFCFKMKIFWIQWTESSQMCEEKYALILKQKQ